MCPRYYVYLQENFHDFLSMSKPQHTAAFRQLKLTMLIRMKPHPQFDRISLTAKWTSLAQSTYSKAELHHSLLKDFHSTFL